MIRLALLLAIAVALAGCGSGAKAPAVASLGGHATTTHDALPTGGTASGGSGGQRLQLKMQVGIRFSRCMRAHGVPSFPDPGSQGNLTFSGVDPNSPAFRNAQRACAKDLPNGGVPTPQEIAKAKQSALAFSACMRKHGVKNFPDPEFDTSSGGLRVRIAIGGPGSGLDPNSQAFQRAQSACGNSFIKGKP